MLGKDHETVFLSSGPGRIALAANLDIQLLSSPVYKVESTAVDTLPLAQEEQLLY